MTSFVERKLKLKVNDTKSQIAPINQCKFLGFTFHGGSLKWHESAVEKFKFQVKQLTGRSNGISMEKRISELTVYLRGWIDYFGIGQGYQKCIDLDHCLLIIEGGVDYACVTGPIVRNNWAAAKLAAGWPTRRGPLTCGAGRAQKSEICSNSVCRWIWLLPAAYRAKAIGEVQKLREFIAGYLMNSLQKKACYR